ncbi:hypothetical protein LGM96_01165 [Burkholderia gladioli]|uniref:hypothetical protein n=1 Tax=Burkholderia gladioli TaxID=28095 RepID=UPI001CF3AE78|nr:hypothetical protein [Burkholderia gladioli]MCA8165916.1 hypothetical protein [Burkholderia gladioli]
MKCSAPIDRKAPLARLRWRAYRLARQLGWIEALACLVVLALPVHHVALSVPERERLAQRGAELKQALAADAPAPRSVGRISLEDLRKTNTDEQAYFVFDTLARHGLHRKSATYRRDSEVKGALERLSIGIALTGSYEGLRGALRVIAEQPLLRIEQLTIERKDIDDTRLEIGLGVSLLGPDT